jgi:hypothetical protein
MCSHCQRRTGPTRFRRARVGRESALSGRDAAAIASRASGRALAFQNVLQEGVISDGPALFFAWLERDGTRVDVPALHRRFPEVEWLSFKR